MKKLIVIAVTSVACLTVGCTDTGRYDAVLSQIDTLMEDHPDSALQRLDSLRIQKANWPKSLCMRFDLLEAKAQNKAFVDFTTDSVAKEFTDYYDSHGSANDRLLAHYLLGCVYRDLGEAPHAVDCYLDAISQADTTTADCDFYTMSCVYSQMANVFHQQLLLSNEISAHKFAIHYAFKAKKLVDVIFHMDIIAGIYLLQNKVDSARILLNDIQRHYSQDGLKQYRLQSLTTKMHLYIENTNQLAEAKRLMDIYEKESNLFDSNKELPPSKRQYYYYKGKYYEGINHLDSAEYYYRNMYHPNMTYVEMDPMYKGLLNVFAKRHQADSIAKYANLYCMANDSSIAKKDQELTAQMAASYNYNRYQKEALEKERIANSSQLTLLSVLILVAVAILITYDKWTIYQRKQKKMRKEYEKITDEYEKNLQTMHFMDTAYQEVIRAIKEEKSKEESENRLKLDSITTEYERNKLMLEEENRRLSDSIRNMEQQRAISSHLKTTEAFMNTEVVKHIKDLVQIPLSKLSEEDWNRLHAELAHYFPDILSDLNAQPKITNQKVRVCLLVMLRIPDSCIANWLSLKANRVSNIKSELNNELFGEGSARSLYNNLRQRYNILST